MTDAEHTPLPWSISEGFSLDGAPQALYVSPADVDCVGIKLETPWREGAWDGDPEARANAKFIVRACNSHYEMLALLIRYRTETPLGNQPHMIAAEADAVIAKAQGIETRSDETPQAAQPVG